MADPQFDPNQPFDAAPPSFDPSKPFETVEPSVSPEGSMSWGQAALSAVTPSTLGSSAWKNASDIVSAVSHPIQTVEGLGQLGLGLIEKVPGANSLLGNEHEKYADAVGRMFMDRYGGLENIKHTLATDPVGIASDVSMFLSGAGAGAKVAQWTARSADVIKATQAADKIAQVSGATSRVAGNMAYYTNPLTPVLAVGEKVGKGAGRIASEIIGRTGTQTGSLPVWLSAVAGYKGGQAGKTFRDHYFERADLDEPVAMAQNAMDTLRSERGALYRSGKVDISKDRTQLKFDDIDNAAAAADDVGTFKGQIIHQSAEDTRQKINAVIQKWRGLDPAQYHTPEGFDALKRTIGDIRDGTDAGTASRLVADRFYNATRDTIVKQAPKYGELMEGYEKASNIIKNLERTLSIPRSAGGPGPGPMIETSLKKLQSVMRDNVNTGYGNRRQLADYLVSHGSPNLLFALAGQSMKPWTPRGFGALIQGEMWPAMVGFAAGGHIGSAVAMGAWLPFMMPKVVGGAAYAGGAAARQINKVPRSVPNVLGSPTLQPAIQRTPGDNLPYFQR